MRLLVNRPEVHYAQVYIDADTPEEALKLVFNGDGEDWATEFSHTLDPEDNAWTVEDPETGKTLAKMTESPDDEDFYVGSDREEE